MDDKRREYPFPPVSAALLSLLAVVLARPALALLYGAVFPGGIGEGTYYLLSALQEIVLFSLPAYLMLDVRYPASRASVRRGPLRVSEAVSFSLAAVLGVFLFSYLSNLWILALDGLGVPLNLDTAVPAPSGPAELVASLLAIAVLPALCEELFFRGLLFSSFEPQGTGRAVAVSALLFALMHGQLTALPLHLLLGFLFGYLMVKTRSIFAPMLYHAFHNGASLVATYLLARSGEAAQEAEAALSLSDTLSLLPSMLFFLILWALLIALPLRARESDGPGAVYALPAGSARLTILEKALLAVVCALLVFTYLYNTWGGLLL